MEKLLVQKQKLELQKLPDETRITADTLLGTGGQGEVWKATDGGQPVAVKVYHLHTASPEQKEALERLVAKGQPAPHFLWPMAMVKDNGTVTSWPSESPISGDSKSSWQGGSSRQCVHCSRLE